MPDDLQELEDKIFARLEQFRKQPAPKPEDEKESNKKKMTTAAVIAACL